MGDVCSTVNFTSPKGFLSGLVIGFAFSASLYGITVMQGYIYFRRYPQDGLLLKIFVAVLIILDTLTTAFTAHGVHASVVDDYLHSAEAMSNVWSLITENYIGIIIAFLVQSFFARRLWLLSQNKTLTASIASLALGSLGSGTWVGAIMYISPALTHFKSSTLRIPTLLGSGCSSLCDILISAGLCYFFHTNRSGLKRSNMLIDNLMRYAIQQGLVTTICQTYVFVTISNSASLSQFLFLPAVMMQSKLYTNSLLATLNVRLYLHTQAAGGGSVVDLEVDSGSLVFTRGTNPATGADTSQSIHIQSRGLTPIDRSLSQSNVFAIRADHTGSTVAVSPKPIVAA
ncbi:hypothetical protein PYCCODRAFT_1438434 [Trametes coccinea BRFM310]|uniref:DUF6534 domain-containing protein n=1 Tax=Trametes coccinea (strain BRFM310) TaxID=1353009 RepID=A0A1Y2IFE0_TRAC3|nr:hypothetical protein PYCCODRAFT_1438434 [Trametes coccinea BRFM310]